MDEFLYNELNKAWKTTCRILFKEEIGELKEYEEWLNEYVKASKEKEVNGKKIYVFPDDYEGNRFIDFKSIDWNKRFEPLNINEIKDIDSIVEALKERFVYAGNIVLGKSEFVEKSTSVFSSFYVYKSVIVEESKYIYNSALAKESSYVFSCEASPKSEFCINSTVSTSKRIFEGLYCFNSSDVYYSVKVDETIEAFFSFGVKGASYIIGNLSIGKEKYLKIKESLLEQIREDLKRDKRIFGIIDLLNSMEEAENKRREERDIEDFNKEIIEKAFSNSSKIILKKELGDIDNYERFLRKHVMSEVFNENLRFESSFSHRIVYIPEYFARFSNKELKFTERLYAEEERDIVSTKTLNEDKVRNLEINKEHLAKILKNIGYACLEFNTGNNINIGESNIIGWAQNCYRGSAYFYSRNCAYCFWPRESEYIFGSNNIFNSSFAINAYSSNNIQRAFEVDNVQNSSDVYFCHNVENIVEGMFNFNVKNMSYAIGNAKYEKDKYLKIKESLLEQIANELEAKKDLKWSIYNIGR